MYFLLQLLLALFAIYSALNFTGEMRLYVPLGCLMGMFVVGRLRQGKIREKRSAKEFLKIGDGKDL